MFIYCVRWLYLDPIFGSGTLKIDKEVKLRFDRVDRDFKYVLQQSVDSKVLQFLKINNIKNLLESMLNLLATTKKSLNDFLEVNHISIDCMYVLNYVLCEKHSALKFINPQKIKSCFL